MHILLEYRGKSENDQSSDVKTCKQTELQFKRCMFQLKISFETSQHIGVLDHSIDYYHFVCRIAIYDRFITRI